MAYTILDNSVRQHLEQERDRLTNERDEIIQAAIAQATSEIDRTLEYLNGLLGGEGSVELTNGKTPKIEIPEVTEAKAEPEQPKRRGRGKAKAAPAEESTPEPKTRKKRSDAGEAKPAAPKTPFDATLKRDFKGLSPAEAIRQVLSDHPDDTYSTDEMIEVLYGSLAQEKMPEARKRVALMMAHGMKKGAYEKVQENPSRFKIVASNAAA